MLLSDSSVFKWNEVWYNVLSRTFSIYKHLGFKMCSKFIICFCNLNHFQDDDALQPVLRNNAIVMNELRTWQGLQKSQSILMDGKYNLII